MAMKHIIKQAILEEPDVDLHRLAYADCLEEEGKVEKANWIRNQIVHPERYVWDGAFCFNRGFPFLYRGFLNDYVIKLVDRETISGLWINGNDVNLLELENCVRWKKIRYLHCPNLEVEKLTFYLGKTILNVGYVEKIDLEIFQIYGLKEFYSSNFDLRWKCCSLGIKWSQGFWNAIKTKHDTTVE